MSVPYKKIFPEAKRQYDKERQRRHRSLSKSPTATILLTNDERRMRRKETQKKHKIKRKLKAVRQKSSFKRWHPEEIDNNNNDDNIKYDDNIYNSSNKNNNNDDNKKNYKRNHNNNNDTNNINNNNRDDERVPHKLQDVYMKNFKSPRFGREKISIKSLLPNKPDEAIDILISTIQSLSKEVISIINANKQNGMIIDENRFMQRIRPPISSINKVKRFRIKEKILQLVRKASCEAMQGYALSSKLKKLDNHQFTI